MTDENTNDKKSPYEAPEVTDFGTLKDRTEAGTGSVGDGPATSS